MTLIWIFLSALFISMPAVLTGSASFITIPLLIHFGLPPHTAVATNKPGIFTMMLTGLIGFRRHLREAPRFYWLMPVLMFAGGMTGAQLLHYLPQRWVQWAILILALFAALPHQGKRNEGNHLAVIPRPAIAWLSATVISLYNGILGPGTLTMFISLFRFRIGLSMPAAIAWGNLMGCLGNLGAIIQFGRLGLIRPGPALAMTAGMLIGSQIGVRVGRRVPSKYLEWLIRIVLIGLVVGLVVRNAG